MNSMLVPLNNSHKHILFGNFKVLGRTFDFSAYLKESIMVWIWFPPPHPPQIWDLVPIHFYKFNGQFLFHFYFFKLDD
jgi:hypothetical protein